MLTNDTDDPNYFRGAYDPRSSGFRNIPKRLAEDTIKYHMWVLDPKLDSSQIYKRLDDILKVSKELTKSLLKDYIWQRDAFSLSLVKQDGKWLLTGTTNFGDSVADEWLIVYLLRHLSKKFPEAWIRLYDTDGEFLLIEACDFIAGWMEPDITENRIWLNKGGIHTISPESSSSHGDKCPLKLDFALDYIGKVLSDPYDHLSHDSHVDAAAFQRLKKYPAAIKDNTHHSLVTIPRKVAYLLRHNAHYISPAIDAFYLRDEVSMKSLTPKDITSLTFPPEDLVTTSLRFNRSGFAQIKSQHFPFPTTWKNIIEELTADANSQPHDFTRLETGIKLTCGFEMLLSSVSNKDNKAVREMKLLLEDLETGDDHLPTNAELNTDPKSRQDDKEDWLNVSMDDFEDLLSAQPKDSKSAQANSSTSTTADKTRPAFSDPGMQEDLRAMTERFNKIMTEQGEAVEDDDEDDDDEDDDEDPDQDIDFDAAEFERIMAEVLGNTPHLPTTSTSSKAGANASTAGIHHSLDTVEEGNENEDEDAETSAEADDINLMTARFESELVAAGAFELDPEIRKQLHEIDTARGAADIDDDDDDDEEIEIDLDAARELLRQLGRSSSVSGADASKAGLKK